MLEGPFPRIKVTLEGDQSIFRGIPERLRLQGSCYAADVATTTLRAYLNEVWKTCEEASTTADPEIVRHLRVTARRTSVALSIFSPLLSKALVASFKQSLRNLRRSAGAARDYDVLSERLQSHLPPESDSSNIRWTWIVAGLLGFSNLLINFIILRFWLSTNNDSLKHLISSL